MIKVRLARGSGDSFGVDDISCAAATHLGFFTREGVDAVWLDRRGGLDAMGAVLGGQADVAYAGFGPIVALRAGGQPCRIFVSQARALAQALVVDKRISGVKQLRGKVWAVDAIGALSHHMARLLVRALGLAEEAILWDPVGPPPLRIAALLEGRVDAALVRTEEALALHRDRRDRVHRVLDCDQLKRLVPLQPHGVLATTEAYERERPEALLALSRAMIAASRALHDDFEAFLSTARAYVQIHLSDGELELLWKREHDSGGWALNGELTPGHWDAQLGLYRKLNPKLRQVTREELIAESFVAAALAGLGVHE